MVRWQRFGSRHSTQLGPRLHTPEVRLQKSDARDCFWRTLVRTERLPFQNKQPSVVRDRAKEEDTLKSQEE